MLSLGSQIVSEHIPQIATGLTAFAAAVGTMFGVNKARPSIEDRVIEKMIPKFREMQQDMEGQTCAMLGDLKKDFGRVSDKIDNIDRRTAMLEGRFQERERDRGRRGGS